MTIYTTFTIQRLCAGQRLGMVGEIQARGQLTWVEYGFVTAQPLDLGLITFHL